MLWEIGLQHQYGRASLSSQGQKTSRYSFPETQEWSHEVKFQIITIIATSTCHVLLCSDIIRLPIKFGIPRWLLLLACTMGDSKVEDFLLKEHPEEATAACGAWPDSVLSQMLQEATQLPVMESEQNRIVSLCPNLAQPTPVFQQNDNTKSQYPK